MNRQSKRRALGALITVIITLLAWRAIPAQSQTPSTLKIESDDTQVLHEGQWISQPTSAASGDGYLYNDPASAGSAPEAVLQLPFAGSTLEVIYVSGPTLGTLALEVDGTVLRTVITTADKTSYGQSTRIDYLTNEDHILRVYAQVGDVVGVDAFIISSSDGTSGAIQSATPRDALGSGGWMATYFRRFPTSTSCTIPALTDSPVPSGATMYGPYPVAEISFDWGSTGGPDVVAPTTDTFGIIFRRTVTFAEDTTLTINYWADDGIRMYDNGVQFTNRWGCYTASPYSTTHTFSAGSHNLEIQYVEVSGIARVAVTFSAPLLQATAIASTQVHLAWTGSFPNETEYRVERSSVGTPNWAEIATLPADSANYDDTGLTCGTYTYRVRAYFGGTATYSPYSNAAAVDTGPCMGTPPTNLTATVVDFGQIRLDWTDNASDETEYRLELSSNGTTNWLNLATVPADTTTYTVTGLFCNTTEYYVVRGYRASDAAFSAYSNVASVTTLPCLTDPPSNLTATALDDSRVQLNWTDTTTSETEFYIYGINLASSASFYVDHISSETTSYTDTGLDCNTTYQYHVGSYRAGDHSWSGYSNDATVTTAPCLPMTPTNLTVTSFTGSAARLTWSGTVDGDWLYIERALGSAANWVELTSTPAGLTFHWDDELTCDMLYYYRVRVYRVSDMAYSSYSNVVMLDTGPCLDNPPTDLIVTNIALGQVQLTWTDHASDETEYHIQSSITGFTHWSDAGIVPADTTIFIATDIACNTTYSFRVQAYRAAYPAYSIFSNEVTALTLPCLAGTPSNLTASTLDNNRIQLTWVDNSLDETGFAIVRSWDSLTGFVTIGGASANETTYIDASASVTCGTTYYYRLNAYRAADHSWTGFSNTASVTTAPCPLLSPSSLTATPLSSSQIQLNWTAASTDETDFRVERSPDGLNNWAEIGTVPANTTTYINTSLTCETPYFYRVRAYNSHDGSFSDYSHIANASTWPCGLPTPTNLVVNSNQPNLIDFTWSDSPYDESEYRIERSLDGINGWTEIGVHIVPPRGEPGGPPQLYLGPYYADMGLGCSAHRYYRVRAYRAENAVFSDYSAVGEGATTICAPSSLAATVVSPIQIQLTWLDNASDETNYRLERSLTGTSGWSTLTTTIPADTTTYIDATVTCGHTYYYRMQAYRSSLTSTSGNSNMANGVIVCNPLVAPTNLTVTPSSPTQIALTWTDNNADETSYRVERSADGVTGWTQIVSLAANTTSYTSSSLTCQTFYYYRVRAYRSTDVSYSPYSDAASASTLSCPPATPTTLIVTAVSTTQIQLTWGDAATDETDYRVERSPNGSTGWVEIAALPANTTSHDDNGLTCSTLYYYRVRAYRGGDGVFSAYSTTVNRRALGCNLPAPSNVVAAGQSPSQILLTWTDNASDESLYRIERSLNGTSNWAEIGTSSANSTTYTNNGLSCGTVYYYRVRAYRAADTSYSSYSTVVNATTTLCLLAVPNNLTATTLSGSQIRLTWADTNSTETNYRVERSSDGTSNWVEIGTVLADTTTYTDSGLSCGTYYYRVRAYRAVDTSYSSYSTVVNATPSTCPLVAPTNLTGMAQSPSQTRLTWTDTNTNETNYRVERSPDGINNWVEIGSAAANNTTYTNTGLTCNTPYQYRVRAYRSADMTYSDYSTIATVTTWLCPVTAPTYFDVRLVIGTQISLNWVDNATDESEYRVERQDFDNSVWVQIAVLAANITTFTDTDSTMRCERSYTYRVRAYRAADGAFSAYSNAVGTGTSRCPIFAPTNLTATVVSGTQINLTWTDNSTNEADFRLVRGDNLTAPELVAIIPANITSYSDTGLICGTSYRYYVQAYRVVDFGASERSNYVTISTALCPVAAPTSLGALTNTRQILLYWIDNAADESAYRVERSTDGTTWTQIADLPSHLRYYIDTGLDCGTPYQYRVRAYRASDGAFSAYSNVLTATTAVCLPDALAVFNPTTHSANLVRTLANPPVSNYYGPYATGFPHGPGGQYVMGDWNGDGMETMGVYLNGAFWYTNDYGQTANWTGIWFGLGGQAVAGHFSASVGHDCIGVTDSGTWTTGDTFFAFYFTCNLTSGATPPLTYQWLSIVLPTSQGHSGSFQFGAGDFDGDGVDSIAIRRGNYIAWTNIAPTTLLSQFSLAQYFGAPGTGDEGGFVVGDWDVNNVDSFGLVYQNGQFYRRDDLQWNSGAYTVQQFTPLVGTPFSVTTWRPI